MVEKEVEIRVRMIRVMEKEEAEEAKWGGVV